ncbi:MAG: tetratricopeptide repeat protein [Verrucomicrobiota bacterium]|nr:tetratricopeptide repeat protein [Verrucomicrobiota bacterium]
MTEHDPEESDALFNFVAWLDANRLTAIIVAGVALIGGFYYYISQFSADQLAGEAGATLEATNMVSRQIGLVPPDSYKSVMNQYPDSSAGRRAWLLWARGLLDARDYEGAQEQFDEFLTQNPKSPMAPGAILGSALCLDELNKMDEAKAKYDQIIKDYPGELVAQYATINLAAIHQEDGQLETAQRLYQELVNTDLTFFERAKIPDINRDGVVNEQDELILQQVGQGITRRMSINLARSLNGLLIKKNPQLRTETSNPRIPSTISPEPESNATILPDNNGTAPESNATTALPKDANATKPKSGKDGSTPKDKAKPEKPKKSSK